MKSIVGVFETFAARHAGARRVADHASGVDNRYVYIVLVGATGKSGRKSRSIESGADDYLTKPFQFDELRARLRAAHRVLALREELTTAAEALHETAAALASLLLTGLWDRTTMWSTFCRHYELVPRFWVQEPLMILIADLDGLKDVDDALKITSSAAGLPA